MKIKILNLIKKYFKRQFEKTESIILQQNYFSILCAIDSTVIHLKLEEGETK